MKIRNPGPPHIHSLPYERMYRHINALQKARRYFVLAGIVTSIILIAALIYNMRYGWMYAVFMALASGLVCFGLAVCFFFASRGLGYGAAEERLIFTALEFLRTHNYDHSVVETIKARAEISSAVGPVRSLLPILLIPIIISLLNTLEAMPLLSWLAIALMLETLLFPLAIDTYTANIDGIIRHAIAEYMCEQHTSSSASSQDKDQLLLHALLSQDLSCTTIEKKTGRSSG